jgi:HAD superfamily hydrolase (TIGR01509 family)
MDTTQRHHILQKAFRCLAASVFLASAFSSPHILAQTTSDGSADPSGGLPTTSEPVTAARATSSDPAADPAAPSTASGATPEPIIPRAAATSAPASGSSAGSSGSGLVEPTPTLLPSPATSLAPDAAPTVPTGSLPVDQFAGDEKDMGLGTVALLVLAVAAGVAAAFAVVKSFLRGKTKKNTGDHKQEEKKCDDIQSLIEQKKKELEDAIRGWPEEKLKAMARGVIMKELKKNEDVKGAIEEFESAKKKYDDLKKAIELLERRYDLCMLKLPSATRIKAAIFDLNGVFIQSPKLSERFSEAFHVPAEKFLPALEEVMAKVRLPGAGDLYAYWKPYLEAWGVALTREQLIDFWFKAEKEAVEMTELARELKKKGFKIFILSNNFRERTEYYDKAFPALKEIPGKVYYSWQTGYIKTSEEAHKAILKENDLKPGECIFFDDSEKNVETARKVGIKAYVYKGPEQVREFLG